MASSLKNPTDWVKKKPPDERLEENLDGQKGVRHAYPGAIYWHNSYEGPERMGSYQSIDMGDRVLEPLVPEGTRSRLLSALLLKV